MYRSNVLLETSTYAQASCLVCPIFQLLIALLILELNETFGELFVPLTRLRACFLPIAHVKVCKVQMTSTPKIERRAPDMVHSDNRRRDFAIRMSAARVRGAPSACRQRQAGSQAAQFEFQTKLRGGKSMD